MATNPNTIKKNMASKRLTTDAKLDALRTLIDRGRNVNSDNKELISALNKALNDKSNFLAAKAADWIAEYLLYDMVSALCSAYNRFLQKPLKTDKTCAAKRAISRALYTLDYDEKNFYYLGLRYRQMEPVYGGRVDTAVELRCTCALGLVASGDSRVMLDIIDLLHDDEHQARIGAIKAIALAQPFHAELLLRNKILQGDPEPEVINAGFIALVQVAAEDSLEFLTRFLDFAIPSMGEAAALALGESRLDDALALLTTASEKFSPHHTFQVVLYRAIALQRNEKAYNYLLSIIQQQDTKPACEAISALSIFNYNNELKNKIQAIVKQKSSKKLAAYFKKYW
ncbi:MAG: HEAT repeat domain-containing protein [Gammaproteobacteria bacterium]|nr:HEAT repeat domain-containing protein [Gammaproteobacteria bacterium]